MSRGWSLWRRVLIALLAALAFSPVSEGSNQEEAQEPRPRIVAVGDVHGSPDAFSRLLKAAELVDEAGDWIGGNAVLVQTGDLTDRGTGVREVLDLMRNLEQAAAEDGGQVVSLLGNHEVFNLVAYYDYQSTPLPVFTEIAAAFGNSESETTRKRAFKEWSAWARKYPNCGVARKADWMARNPLGMVEYQEAMSPRGEYGRWLRARKIVANVQDTLFLHGGLSPELLDMGMTSLASINDTAAAELAQFDRDREALEKEGLIPRHSTLSELHCALTFELKALGEDSNNERKSLRRKTLEEVRSRLPGAEGWLLLDPRGPVWFRGYASWTDEEAEAGLATVFGSFGGARVVVGHTPQPGAIVARFDEQVFLIDTAMAYPDLKGKAVAFEIQDGVTSAITEGGRVALIAHEPATVEALNDEIVDPVASGIGDEDEDGDRDRDQAGGGDSGAVVVPGEPVKALDTAVVGEVGSSGEPGVASDGDNGETVERESGWLAQDGSQLPFADDEAVLDFLRTARIVEKETMGKGITRAQKFLLEKDGVRARAVFHDINKTEPRYRPKKGPLILNFRDSYLNNVAAFELGRLLGVTNLAPTTVRKRGRTSGSIQLWIEETIDETERRKRDAGKAKSVWMRRRIADMWVFDNLINNLDRNQGNMLHDSRGEFWMIDHTRCFTASKKLPSPERVRRSSRGLLEAIRNLDEDQVRQRLRPYLSPLELKSLFVRRRQLLAHLDERIAARGESNFLFSYDDPDDLVTVHQEEEDIPTAADDG